MRIIDEIRKLLVRRNHKDSLFCDLFSQKGYALVAIQNPSVSE